MYKERNFSEEWGGGGVDLKEVWLWLCCGNPSILNLFKAKCIKIATLFKKLGEIDPGGNSAYERGGMLVGNFELNS